MKSTRRIVRLALGVATGVALALSGALPASAATTEATAFSSETTDTWTVQDINQRICVTSRSGHPSTYFLVPVYGSWSTTLTTGIRNLPPGATSSGGTPISPGSNYGPTVLGFVQLSVPPLPVGVYAAEVWASDGTETHSAPATINVQENC